MIKINKEIINNMVEVYKLEKHLNIIVDYEKEDELTRKKRNLVTQFSNFYNTNTIDTLIQVVNDIDNINDIEQLYIYEPDEIIDVFFDDTINISFKNNIITSLFYWLENDQTKARWIECNLFCLASNRKLYDKIFNINDNYFLSTIDLNKLTLNDIKC